MAAWKTCKLGEVCVKIGSGATPLGGAAGYLPSGVAFIRSQNVYNLHFETDGLAHLSEAAARKLQSVSVERGDVLLNITGDSVARTCLVPERVLPARVSQHVLIIRADRAKVFPSFLSYQLASPRTQAWLLGLAVGRGASRNALTKEMVASLEISLPSLSEQERIAGVLGAYDDLIALNARRMALLEEAAHRLYRERFVTHADPAWPSRPLGEVAEVIGGGTPSTAEETYWDGDVPWITPRDLSGYSLPLIERGARNLSKEGLRHSGAQLLPKGSVLVTSRAPIGYVVMAANAVSTNQGFKSLVLQDGQSACFFYYLMRDNVALLRRVAKGSTFPELSTSAMRALEFRFPPIDEQRAFEEQVAPYFEAVGVLARENALLREARDGLLPRLLREA